MASVRLLSPSSVVVVIVALWIVGGTTLEENSCQDLESIEPCDADAVLNVAFGRCGVRVSPAAASAAPRVTYSKAADGKKYLLVMVDPDAPSAHNPKMRYWRHWVMSDISGSSLKSDHLDGITLTEYNGPSPPRGSGPHRYHLFLFEQPGELQSSSDLGNGNRGKWQLRDFVRDNQLCHSLVASYEFISENK